MFVTKFETPESIHILKYIIIQSRRESQLFQQYLVHLQKQVIGYILKMNTDFEIQLLLLNFSLLLNYKKKTKKTTQIYIFLTIYISGKHQGRSPSSLTILQTYSFLCDSMREIVLKFMEQCLASGRYSRMITSVPKMQHKTCNILEPLS